MISIIVFRTSYQAFIKLNILKAYSEIQSFKKIIDLNFQGIDSTFEIPSSDCFPLFLKNILWMLILNGN